MNPSSLISRRRTELMGLAALWIVIHHSGLKLPFGLWNSVMVRSGAMGVDFFVFLSGFGCVFSLKKPTGFGRYYVRRLKRLLPTYYVCLALMYAIVGIPSFSSLASSIIPLNVWTGEPGGSWYIGASLVYYLIVPAALALLEHARHPRAAFAALLFTAALVVPCATRQTIWTLATMRLPALMCGVGAGAMFCAKPARRDWIAACAVVAVMFAAGWALKLHPYLLSRAPLDLISRKQGSYLGLTLRAPLWLLATAAVMEGIERTPLRWLNVPLRFAGGLSLELYIGHELVSAFFVTCFGFSGARQTAVMLGLAIPVAIAIRWIVKGLTRLAGKLPPLLKA